MSSDTPNSEDSGEDLLPETSMFVFADVTETDRLVPTLPSLDSLSSRNRFTPGADPAEKPTPHSSTPDSLVPPRVPESPSPPVPAAEIDPSPERGLLPLPSLSSLPDLDKPIRGGAAIDVPRSPTPTPSGSSVFAGETAAGSLDAPRTQTSTATATDTFLHGDGDAGEDFLRTGRRADALIGVLALGVLVAVGSAIGAYFLLFSNPDAGSEQVAVGAVAERVDVQTLLDDAANPLPQPTAQFLQATPTPIPTATPLPTATPIPTPTAVPPTPEPAVAAESDSETESDGDAQTRDDDSTDADASDTTTADAAEESTEATDSAANDDESTTAESADSSDSDSSDDSTADTSDSGSDTSDSSDDDETGDIDSGDTGTSDSGDDSDDGTEVASGVIEGRSGGGQSLGLEIDPTTGQASFTGETDAAPTTGGIGATSDIATLEQHLIATINSVRSEAGVGPLSPTTSLMTKSSQWAEHMAEAQTLIHCGDCIQAPMPPVCVKLPWAENIGQGSTVELIEVALRESSLHYQNMTNPEFTQVGVGISYANELWWVTHTFGVDC